MSGLFLGEKEPALEAGPITLSAFKDLIFDALVGNGFDSRKFLPEKKALGLASESQVRSLLPRASPSLVEFVCQRARRVFLIVSWSRDGSADELMSIMDTFQKFEMTDDDLPIDNIVGRDGTCKGRDTKACTHGDTLNVFHYNGWTPRSISGFHDNQWIFCPPVFKKSEFHQELKAACILPFTWVSKHEKDGHFSTVFEAKLHADQHQGDSDLARGDQHEVHVALKKLKSLFSELEYNVEAMWKREVLALNQIGELRHKNLIRRIAAFKRGTEHYIMFEWANGGNLRDIWKSEAERRNLDGDRIMCVLEQLVGLAGALSKLHNTNTNTKTGIASAPNKRADLVTGAKSKTTSSSLANGDDTSATAGFLRVPQVRFQLDSSDDDYYTSDDVDHAREEHWRHGDLKPENILQFKESTWLGTLKIADLGLAKQHKFATGRRNEQTEQSFATLQYEAPEVITNRNLPVPRSRRYDIWSMGCIILEFTIWLLYGYDGLNAFNKEGDHIDNSAQTLYFTVDKNERTARVSDIATSWMNHMLQNDPECNGSSGSAIRDLINLVKDKLLVVALPKDGMDVKALEKCRVDASELEIDLKDIWKKARDDELKRGNYFVTGSSRAGVPTPPPIRSQGTSFLSTNNRSPGVQSTPRNLEVRVSAA